MIVVQEVINQIAQDNFGIESLSTVAVSNAPIAIFDVNAWMVQEALMAAFMAGRQSVNSPDFRENS